MKYGKLFRIYKKPKQKNVFINFRLQSHLDHIIQRKRENSTECWGQTETQIYLKKLYSTLRIRNHIYALPTISSTSWLFNRKNLYVSGSCKSNGILCAHSESKCTLHFSPALKQLVKQIVSYTGQGV